MNKLFLKKHFSSEETFRHVSIFNLVQSKNPVLTQTWAHHHSLWWWWSNLKGPGNRDPIPRFKAKNRFMNSTFQGIQFKIGRRRNPEKLLFSLVYHRKSVSLLKKYSHFYEFFQRRRVNIKKNWIQNTFFLFFPEKISLKNNENFHFSKKKTRKSTIFQTKMQTFSNFS